MYIFVQLQATCTYIYSIQYALVLHVCFYLNINFKLGK